MQKLSDIPYEHGFVVKFCCEISRKCVSVCVCVLLGGCVYLCVFEDRITSEGSVSENHLENVSRAPLRADHVHILGPGKDNEVRGAK